MGWLAKVYNSAFETRVLNCARALYARPGALLALLLLAEFSLRVA
jgi:hypothetical protein